MYSTPFSPTGKVKLWTLALTVWWEVSGRHFILLGKFYTCTVAVVVDDLFVNNNKFKPIHYLFPQALYLFISFGVLNHTYTSSVIAYLLLICHG